MFPKHMRHAHHVLPEEAVKQKRGLHGWALDVPLDLVDFTRPRTVRPIAFGGTERCPFLNSYRGSVLQGKGRIGRLAIRGTRKQRLFRNWQVRLAPHSSRSEPQGPPVELRQIRRRNEDNVWWSGLSTVSPTRRLPPSRSSAVTSSFSHPGASIDCVCFPGRWG